MLDLGTPDEGDVDDKHPEDNCVKERVRPERQEADHVVLVRATEEEQREVPDCPDDT
jgi:hypothetical protein